MRKTDILAEHLQRALLRIDALEREVARMQQPAQPAQAAPTDIATRRPIVIPAIGDLRRAM